MRGEGKGREGKGERDKYQANLTLLLELLFYSLNVGRDADRAVEGSHTNFP